MSTLPVISDLECRRCAACCQYAGHPPFDGNPIRPGQTPTERWWIDLPDGLKQPLLEYLRGLPTTDLGRPCIWLASDGGCKHYDFRPQACRDFERGGADCLRLRREAGQTP